MILCRYKYQLVQHRRNKYLNRKIDIAGLVWNHAIALQRRFYQLTGNTIQPSRLTSHLRKLRRACARYAHWHQLSSHAIAFIVKRLDTAYQRYFKGLSRLPRFRKVKKYKSFEVYGNNWELLDCVKGKYQRIRIGKQIYSFYLSRPLPASAKPTLTIKRTPNGKLWLSFLVKVSLSQVKSLTNEIEGFDFGLKRYLTDHTGQATASPLFFKRVRGQIQQCHRQLSRKAKGSKNCYRARLALGRTYASISHKRADFQWKLAHALCDAHDVLCFEDLNLSGMKRLWGPKISDLSHRSFLLKLEWVACKRGKRLVKAGRFYPSSQRCSGCGAIKEEMPLRERVYHCTHCGMTRDRDHNAALNIKEAGERLLQEGCQTENTPLAR